MAAVAASAAWSPLALSSVASVVGQVVHLAVSCRFVALGLDSAFARAALPYSDSDSGSDSGSDSDSDSGSDFDFDSDSVDFE